MTVLITDRRRELVQPLAPDTGELAARRAMRAQITQIDRQLADAFVTAYRLGGIEASAQRPGEARLLDLGELERVRDDLAERLRRAHTRISTRADEIEANRVELERMFLNPATHRFKRISRADLGEPGCGVWQVRPRLGLVGMLMGWWEVKLSSGCPLAGGRGATPRPAPPGGTA